MKIEMKKKKYISEKEKKEIKKKIMKKTVTTTPDIDRKRRHKTACKLRVSEVKWLFSERPTVTGPNIASTVNLARPRRESIRRVVSGHGC